MLRAYGTPVFRLLFFQRIEIRRYKIERAYGSADVARLGLNQLSPILNEVVFAIRHMFRAYGTPSAVVVPIPRIDIRGYNIERPDGSMLRTQRFGDSC